MKKSMRLMIVIIGITVGFEAMADGVADISRGGWRFLNKSQYPMQIAAYIDNNLVAVVTIPADGITPLVLGTVWGPNPTAAKMNRFVITSEIVNAVILLTPASDAQKATCMYVKSDEKGHPLPGVKPVNVPLDDVLESRRREAAVFTINIGKITPPGGISVKAGPTF